MGSKRRLAWTCGTLVALTALGGGIWAADPFGLGTTIDTGGADPEQAADASTSRSTRLAEARRAGTVEALSAFIAAQRTLIEERPNDATLWRVLAEAYLERSQQRVSHKGMSVSRPMYDEVPPAVRQDLDLGDAALAKARELGDATSESYRIEAALISGRITGLVTVMRLRSSITHAISTALELDPTNPRALVSAACQKLFNPFSSEVDQARADFLRAAKALPLDERPLVFASLAAFLSDDLEGAIEHCREAAERTPGSAYANEVLRRLEAGEDDPFGRDL